MNNQLKLLLYMLFFVAVFLYVQERFHIFDITYPDSRENSSSEDEDGNETSPVVEEKKGNSYVEIFLSSGESIKVNVEVADNDVKRTLGLSNRRYLGDYDGMLFVFDEKGNYPFWMKDTLISLDMVYIDDTGFIVYINKDNQPCTEYSCPSIFSNYSFKYVLEVNGGFCDENSIVVGNSVVLHLASN